MKLFFSVVVALLAVSCADSSSGREATPPAIATYPSDELDAEVLSACINDYKKRYREGKQIKNYLRFDYKVLTSEEASRHRFLQQPQLVPGQRYVLVTICDLPPRVLGGAAEYLVNPNTREILAWTHGK